MAIAPGTFSGEVPTFRPLLKADHVTTHTIPIGRDGDSYRRVPEAAWQMLLHEHEHEQELTHAGGRAGDVPGRPADGGPSAYFRWPGVPSGLL